MKDFIQSPHAASHTRDSDITESPWPCVTKSLLADHEKLEASHTPEQINQGVFALIRARKAVHDALLSVCFCQRLHREDGATHGRLAALAERLTACHADFPLTILENAKNRPRRHIMAGQDSVDRPTPWGVED
jgi:hypothetical protein